MKTMKWKAIETMKEKWNGNKWRRNINEKQKQWKKAKTNGVAAVMAMARESNQP